MGSLGLGLIRGFAGRLVDLLVLYWEHWVCIYIKHNVSLIANLQFSFRKKHVLKYSLSQNGARVTPSTNDNINKCMIYKVMEYWNTLI